jgi:ankyrin repeat protein
MTDTGFQDADTTERETAETACRKALFLTDPCIDRQNLIDKKGLRVAGTCEWIESNETYRSWLYGDPGIMWIFGGPGKGKTMLSIYLTQQLERWHNEGTMYFFCSSEHATRSTACAVLRTLLWQITVQRPELTGLILPYFDPPERMHAMLSTAGSLWEIFVKVIQSDKTGTICCVIDGLDECDEESSSWLASQFNALSKDFGSAKLRATLVSRHKYSLEDIKQIHLDPDNDDSVGHDIEKFTTAKMLELSQRVELTTIASERIQAVLLRKAEGTFLWIGYAMVELLTKRTGLEVEEAVGELPRALPALYGRMIRRVPPNKLKDVIALLHWVTLAAAPLFLEELAGAIVWRIPEHMNELQVLRDYIKLCEPLIIVQLGRAVLVHQSAKDYFLRQTKDDDHLAESVRSTFTNAHLSLARKCIAALGKTAPLSPYANVYWSEHVRQCPEADQVSLLTEENFFGSDPIPRRSWWAELAPHYHYGDGIDTPRLHIACYIGLVVWARMILDEATHDDAVQKSQTRSGSFLAWIKSTDPQRVNVNLRFMCRTPLHYALAGKGSLDIVSYLLANGADPNARDEAGGTPLSYAACMARLDAMKLLVAHGADPDGCFKFDYNVKATPLRYTVEDMVTSTDVAALLIELGADIHAADVYRDRPGATLVQRAASKGLSSLVEMLLDRGADASKDWNSLIEMLPLLGADPQAATDAGSPLQLAMEQGHGHLPAPLLLHTASCSELPKDCTKWPLYIAMVRAQLSLVQSIIHPSDGPPQIQSATVLLWTAILQGNVDGVYSALKQGIDPNIATLNSRGCPDGLTSLHWTVIEWQRQGYNTFTMEQFGAILRKLLEYGANPDLQDEEGRTALQRAENRGRVWAAVAKIIAQSGGRANANTPGVGCNFALLRTGGSR